MPNRILREGILTSERVNGLSPQGELFYRRLMSVVDDFGRFDGRPQMLRVSCFPLRVDRVREADISRWLDELQTAGLIALYAANGKPYLEMHDFRQQVRAKESRYPAQPETLGDCTADATQTLCDCTADAHLDGGGGGGEGEDDKTTPPPSAGNSESFRMHSDWTPSPHLGSIARQAGLLVPGSEEFKAALGEFIAYWMSQNRMRTQHEWDHTLIKSFKTDRLRGGNAKPATGGKRKPAPDNFDNRDYGQGGRL